MRKVLIIDTGETFNSVRELVNYIDGDYRTALKVLSGERKSHKGYTFVYHGTRKVLDVGSGKLYDTVDACVDAVGGSIGGLYRHLRGDRLHYRGRVYKIVE